MTETEFLKTENLTKLRIAHQIISDILTGDTGNKYGVTFAERAELVRKIESLVDRNRGKLRLRE